MNITLTLATYLKIFTYESHPSGWQPHSPAAAAASPGRTEVGPAQTPRKELKEHNKESSVIQI